MAAAGASAGCAGAATGGADAALRIGIGGGGTTGAELGVMGGGFMRITTGEEANEDGASFFGARGDAVTEEAAEPHAPQAEGE